MDRLRHIAPHQKMIVHGQRDLSFVFASSRSWRLCLSLCKSSSTYTLCFKLKVTFGHKLRYETKISFGEISLKLRQTNWNVAKNYINVVVDELPSQITVYTCLTIDIWTRQHWCTSTQFYALHCHLPKLVGFQWKWCQKFLTLLWTPLARQKALSESYATHAVSCLKKCKKWPSAHGFPKT